MTLQKLLLAAAVLALVATSGCAQTYKQASAEALAGDQDSKLGQEAHTLYVLTNGRALTREGTPEFDMGIETDVQVIEGEDGERIVIINGKKLDGKVLEWENLDGKDMKLHMKRMVENGKDNSTHTIVLKKHMKDHKLHGEHFKSADLDHTQKMVTRLAMHLEGIEGKKGTQVLIFDDDATEGLEGLRNFPRIMHLEDNVQVFVEKDGEIRVMKDGKQIETDSSNIKVDKTVTMKDGKRTTRIVIELEDDNED
ncbi:MAG: hypothetical protein COA69_09990 [Robiginitomaculum sp.]|nr:MAG: hypothetical protein COA69_09990 [Robiginitomaculum sp.]